jgi:hypothetical protein
MMQQVAGAHHLTYCKYCAKPIAFMAKRPYDAVQVSTGEIFATGEHFKTCEVRKNDREERNCVYCALASGRRLEEVQKLARWVKPCSRHQAESFTYAGRSWDSVESSLYEIAKMEKQQAKRQEKAMEIAAQHIPMEQWT